MYVVSPAIEGRIAEPKDFRRDGLVVFYDIFDLLYRGHAFHKRYDFPGYIRKGGQLLRARNDVFDQQFVVESVDFMFAKLTNHV